MNILLVYPPFVSPASPPYSIANLKGFLNKNIKLNGLDHKICTFDANLFVLKDKISNNLSKFKKELDELSSKTNKGIIHDKYKDDTILNEILKHKPDIVCFSVIYSSQAFTSYYLIKKLNELGIKTIVGGENVPEKLKKQSTYLDNREELWKHLFKEKIKSHNTVLEFEKNNYITKVHSIKTSNTCPFKQCAFCTHHKNEKYKEIPLKDIEQTIINNNIKKVFLIDDMLTKKRLLEISTLLKKYKISFFCQLKPTKEWDKETLEILKNDGLKMIIWGVESGNDKLLKNMRKGTNVNDIESILENSNVKNVVYIMFGFPGETKETFLDTIEFLKRNEKRISLVSTSVFGLQSNSYVYKNPDLFKIVKINHKQRTLLNDKITYEIIKPLLGEEETNILRKKYKKTINNINKYPKEMHFFRECML